MKAGLILRSKVVLPDGAIRELVIWKVPEPVPPGTHLFKYRLVYAVSGERVVGFDNERGKGDHWHYDGAELAYPFTGWRMLLADFTAIVEALRR